MKMVRFRVGLKYRLCASEYNNEGSQHKGRHTSFLESIEKLREKKHLGNFFNMNLY